MVSADEIAPAIACGSEPVFDTAQTRCPGRLKLHYDNNWQEMNMSLGTILLIVLVLILLGVVPAWPHSRGWGYGPSGIVGLVLVVLLVLFFTGRI